MRNGGERLATAPANHGAALHHIIQAKALREHFSLLRRERAGELSEYQQKEGAEGLCAKADFQSTGKRCAAASRVAVGKSQGSGRRERSFWSAEGTDYLDERLGRLSETVEVPHSSSVSDSSFLRRPS